MHNDWVADCWLVEPLVYMLQVQTIRDGPNLVADGSWGSFVTAIVVCLKARCRILEWMMVCIRLYEYEESFEFSSMFAFNLNIYFWLYHV